MKLNLVVLTYSILFLSTYCQSDNSDSSKEVVILQLSQKMNMTDSTENKLIRVTSQGNAVYDLGFFDKKLFLDSNIVQLKEIENIYAFPIYKGRTSQEEQFRLIAYNNVYSNFETYILFDELGGEAGCYALCNIDSLGFVIDMIEFKGGDGWENGGYSTESKFVNKDLIKQTTEQTDREVDEFGEYLSTWTKKITKTEYLISSNGFIYIKNKKDSVLTGLKERY